MTNLDQVKPYIPLHEIAKSTCYKIKMPSTDSIAVKCQNYCLFTMLLGVPTLSGVLTL